MKKKYRTKSKKIKEIREKLRINIKYKKLFIKISFLKYKFIFLLIKDKII